MRPSFIRRGVCASSCLCLSHNQVLRLSAFTETSRRVRQLKRSMRESWVQASFLLVLEPETVLTVVPGLCGQRATRKLMVLDDMQPGDMLVYRGDLPHAEEASSKRNLRIQGCLNVDGIDRNAGWLSGLRGRSTDACTASRGVTVSEFYRTTCDTATTTRTRRRSLQSASKTTTKVRTVRCASTISKRKYVRCS